MTDPFEIALGIVLHHEGGFVNDGTDPGGVTKYGISLRWLKAVGDLDGDGLPDGDIDGDGDVDADDIKALTPDHARRIYRLGWWDRYGYGRFDLPLAVKLFDTAINTGARQCGRIAQRAANDCGYNLVVDGNIGPKSREVIRAIPARNILPAFRVEQADFYRHVVEKNAKMKKYLDGWLNRAAT